MTIPVAIKNREAFLPYTSATISFAINVNGKINKPAETVTPKMCTNFDPSRVEVISEEINNAVKIMNPGENERALILDMRPNLTDSPVFHNQDRILYTRGNPDLYPSKT